VVDVLAEVPIRKVVVTGPINGLAFYFQNVTVLVRVLVLG
jgi:hypothetical protein